MSIANLHESLCFIVDTVWVRMIVTMQIDIGNTKNGKNKVNIRLC